MKKLKKINLNLEKEVISFLSGNEMNSIKGGNILTVNENGTCSVCDFYTLDVFACPTNHTEGNECLTIGSCYCKTIGNTCNATCEHTCSISGPVDPLFPTAISDCFCLSDYCVTMTCLTETPVSDCLRAPI